MSKDKARVIITIDEEGQTEVKVEGGNGSSCKALTAGIEKALGATTGDKKLPEYFKPVAEVGTNARR